MPITSLEWTLAFSAVLVTGGATFIALGRLLRADLGGRP
jgi:hypothetical protein